MSFFLCFLPFESTKVDELGWGLFLLREVPVNLTILRNFFISQNSRQAESRPMEAKSQVIPGMTWSSVVARGGLQAAPRSEIQVCMKTKMTIYRRAG